MHEHSFSEWQIKYSQGKPVEQFKTCDCGAVAIKPLEPGVTYPNSD